MRVKLNNKGLTLVEVLVSAVIFSGIALVITNSLSPENEVRKRYQKISHLEEYSRNFLKVINRKRDNLNKEICSEIFSGIVPYLTSSKNNYHNINSANQTLEITHTNLKRLVSGSPFFERNKMGKYELVRIKLSGDREGTGGGLIQIDRAQSFQHEHLFRGEVSFIFKNTKTNNEIESKKESLIFSFTQDTLISCSGLSSIDFSGVGVCEMFGPHSRIDTTDGKCVIPQSNLQNPLRGSRIDWTRASELNFVKINDALCDLQKRAGVLEGSVCQ